MGNCNYYSENTAIDIKDDSIAVAESIETLNSKEFYIETLHWEESVWDFSNLDCEGNKLPAIKAN